LLIGFRLIFLAAECGLFHVCMNHTQLLNVVIYNYKQCYKD
jgi:hypothetical protein